MHGGMEGFARDAETAQRKRKDRQRKRAEREIKATAKDGTRKLTCCLFLETQGVAGVKRGEGCENGATLIREILPYQQSSVEDSRTIMWEGSTEEGWKLSAEFPISCLRFDCFLLSCVNRECKFVHPCQHKRNFLHST